jgi:hypothetical protein
MAHWSIYPKACHKNSENCIIINNNNNNNNLFSIRYSNTLYYTIYKVLLYNIGIKKIGNSRLLVFVYNKIL